MNVSIVNLIKIKEIRSKLLITLGLLLCYRVGFSIPLPGVDVREFFEQGAGSGAGLFGIMNVLTGAALQQATLFSLGVMPYISSSIIFSL